MSDLTNSLDRISYCGLDCSICYLKNGHIADHATALHLELMEIQFEKWGPPLANLNPKELASFCFSKECMEVLKAWDLMRCEQTCKQGGGSSRCAIRECCRDKEIEGCYECSGAEFCEKLGALKPVNGSLNIENIRKIRKEGLDTFLEESSKSPRLKFYWEPEAS